MTNLIDYIFLAIIQGVTEFLPVSSSGHIEFLKNVFDNSNIQEQGAFLTVILHLATAMSIIFIFRKKIKSLLLIKNDDSKNYIINILISLIPIAILVIFNIDQIIEEKYDNGWSLNFVSFMFFITGFILFITEKINIKTKKITLLTALLVGIAQSIAILPGISRSGATICCALLLGASKKKHLLFSFLICLPVIFGKSAMDILSLEFTSLINFNPYILISFVVTFVIGCLCCNWMIKIVDNSKLKYFGYYCLIISLLVFSFENF